MAGAILRETRTLIHKLTCFYHLLTEKGMHCSITDITFRSVIVKDCNCSLLPEITDESDM